MESRKGGKLTKVVKNVYVMPDEFYRRSFAMLMNQDAIDGLPEDIKRAPEENVFGEIHSRKFGWVWQQIDDEGQAVTEATGRNAIISVFNEATAAFQLISGKMNMQVLAELNDRGVSGNAAYELIKAELAAYRHVIGVGAFRRSTSSRPSGKDRMARESSCLSAYVRAAKPCSTRAAINFQ